MNNVYIRTAPDGRELEIVPRNQSDLEYYRDLESHGFTFKPKMRIHRAVDNSACLSCQG